MTGERETMQLIRQAIRQGRLKEPLRGADLNLANNNSIPQNHSRRLSAG